MPTTRRRDTTNRRLRTLRLRARFARTGGYKLTKKLRVLTDDDAAEILQTLPILENQLIGAGRTTALLELRELRDEVEKFAS